MTKVEIRNINKAYQSSVPVLSSCNLSIEPGELFFLLGPSGCGKSTLLRIVAGLVNQDSGSITFNGREIGNLPPEKRKAAMVFQNYALWPHLTVFENVAFGLRIQKMGGEAIRQEVAAALKLVDLAGYADRKITSLSGGQQQRVALARALAVRPEVLLLDEPLSNLDARFRDLMREEIKRICKERSQTAIYVTHDRHEALSMADQVAVMHNGVIEQVGTPEALYERPVNRFVATFLGDINIFGNLMVRPENLRFDCPDNAFEAQLVKRTYLGDHCEWRLQHQDRQLIVIESGRAVRRELGQTCRLGYASADAVTLRD